MGLLGNVAEVPSLRHMLMTKEFVEEFSFLLDSCSDGKDLKAKHEKQQKLHFLSKSPKSVKNLDQISNFISLSISCVFLSAID